MSNYNYRLQKNPKCDKKGSNVETLRCDQMNVRAAHWVITLGATK